MNFYELGGELYHDWKIGDYTTHEKLRLLDLKENIETLKSGFIDERKLSVHENYDNENMECFFGAMDEIGIEYWT